MNACRALVVGIVVSFTSGLQRAEAQEFQGFFEGDLPLDNFGLSVSTAGDVDADGFDDFLSGGYRGDFIGRIKVISGQTGALLYHITGTQSGQAIGLKVSPAGDVNNDGFDDFMESSLNNVTQVFSGQNGSLLYTLPGTLRGVYGDRNSDGFSDVVVGSSIHSGFDGSVLHTYSGPISRLVGDVNGDQEPDYAGFFNPGGPISNGQFVVRSGADDSIIHVLPGDSEGFITGAGDVNADGFDDTISARTFDTGGPIEGPNAAVHSGIDGSLLYSFPLTLSVIFEPVNSAGDSDGDGHDDFLISGLTTSRLHSGRNGCVLAEFQRANSLAIGNAGDIDMDGDPDVVLGTTLNISANGLMTAAWFTYDGPVGTSFCTGSPNSFGTGAEISASGTPSFARNDLLLNAGGVPPGEPGLFYFGGAQIAAPFGDGVRCVGAGVGGVFRLPPTAADLNGCFDTRIDNSASPGSALVAGSTWNFQGWYRDGAAMMSSFNLTDGLEIAFLP